MKNNILNKSKLLIIAMIFIGSGAAIGQEFIKEPQLKHTTSIVREVAYQRWLTYTYDGDYSYFTLVSETGTTAPTLTLPFKYYVSDFEIYKDTVYFCGHFDSLRTEAIFGYFSLATFPSSTVYCKRISPLINLKKLVVFTNENKPHIVFTGTETFSKSILLDATISSINTWNFAIASHTDIESNVYDDVAVTNDYIIATSRILELDSGLIHYFNKPMSYSSIFPFHHIFRGIGYPTISPILITACHDNFFATLCKTSNTSFVMSKYNTFNDELSLMSNAMNLECRDINFNDNSGNIEVLIHAKWIKDESSIALHYKYFLTGTALIPLHKFENKSLYSIDYLTHQPDFFIGTGDSLSDGILQIYRYKYDTWLNCTIESCLFARKIENYYKSFTYHYTTMLPIVEILPITCDILSVNVYTRCESYKEE